MKCEFVLVDGKCQCTRCGRRMKAEDCERAHAACFPPCVHRGDTVGRRIKISCGHCTTRDQPYLCELHGRCLTKFRGPWGPEQAGVEGKLYTLCHGCADYSQ